MIRKFIYAIEVYCAIWFSKFRKFDLKFPRKYTSYDVTRVNYFGVCPSYCSVRLFVGCVETIFRKIDKLKCGYEVIEKIDGLQKAEEREEILTLAAQYLIIIPTGHAT